MTKMQVMINDTLVEEASKALELARQNPNDPKLMKRALELQEKAKMPIPDPEVRIVPPEGVSQSRR